MTPTTTSPGRLRLRDRRQRAGDVLIAAFALIVLVAAAAFDRPHPFVARIEVVNPTVYQVEIDVLPTGGFRRESTRTVFEVHDQGARWRFRFSYGGTFAGELTLTRAQLQLDGWRVTIPVEVGQRLAEAGLPPTATAGG